MPRFKLKIPPLAKKLARSRSRSKLKIKKPKPIAKPKGENEFWFNKGKRAFMVGNTTCRGVHKALYSSIICKASASDLKQYQMDPPEKPIAVAKLTTTELGRTLTRYHKSRKGMNRGKLVHSHIEKICNRSRDRRMGLAVPKREIKIHPQAELAFRLLHKLDATPEHGELDVAWKSAKLATRIDTTATLNKTKQRLVAETKTGRLGTHPRWRLRFPPYTLFSDRGKSFLQLLVSIILHNHTYPGVVIGDAVTLHLETNALGVAYHMPRAIKSMYKVVEDKLRRRTRAKPIQH